MDWPQERSTGGIGGKKLAPTPSLLKPWWEDNPPAESAPKEPVAEKERGFFGDIASHTGRGVMRVLRTTGHAIKTLDPEGGLDIAENIGQGFIDTADSAQKTTAFLRPDESEVKGEGFTKRGVMSGIESAPSSLVPSLAGATVGAAIGSVVPIVGTGVGALIGSTLATFGFLGLGTYGEKFQEYKDKGISEEESHRGALKQAVIEGGIEATANFIGLKLFGVDRLVMQPLKTTVKELLTTPAKEFAKKLGTDMVSETITEMLQSGLGAQVETGLGLQDEGAWKEAALESIIPAITMSLLFGMGASALNSAQKSAFIGRLNEGDIQSRLRAVKEISEGIKDPELVDAWHSMALSKIQAGEKIDILKDFSKFGGLGEEGLTRLRNDIIAKATPIQRVLVDDSHGKAIDNLMSDPNLGTELAAIQPPGAGREFAQDTPYADQAAGLGLKYNGMQETGEGTELPWFTDLETGGSFLVGEGETLPQALQRVRDSWKGGQTQGQAQGTQEGQMMEQRELPEKTASPWKSQLLDVVNAKLPGSGPVDQIAGTLDSWAKSGQIKQEELDWSGVKGWLKEKKGKVTKQEVADYIAENNVQVQEVEKGFSPTKKARLDELQTVTDSGKPLQPKDREEYNTLIDEQRGAIESDTKYGSYTLPGGENYSELLLTLPTAKTPANPTQWNVVRSNDGRLISEHNSKAEAERALSEGQEIVPIDRSGSDARVSGSNTYKSSHYDEPNVLAHVRFNERKGPNGERVLFLEEVQSDWHQEGRKKGYKGSVKLDRSEFTAKPDIVSGFYTVIRTDGSTWNRVQAASVESAIDKKITDLTRSAEARSLPDAPFKKTWPTLAIKRMVRYAAENGFDSIAWTPGDVQAERYDLSKHIDGVTYDPYNKRLVAVKNKQRVIDETVKSDEALEDYLGKEVAKKLLESEPNGAGNHNLSGLDLKVGGEGMKGFYDKILPAEVNKFFGKKEWGGAKVGLGELDATDVDDAPRKYTGPEWSVEKLRELDKLNTYGDTSDTPFAVSHEIRDYLLPAMEAGQSFQEIADHLSPPVANFLGGDIEYGKLPAKEAWFLPITPEMKAKALGEGMTMFQDANPAAAQETAAPEPKAVAEFPEATEWFDKLKKWAGKSKIVDENGVTPTPYFEKEREAVYDDILSQLTKGQRLAKTAKADAAYWAAFTATWAKRYGGSPLDIYNQIRPDVNANAGERPGVRGSVYIMPKRNPVVSLYKTADASTFLHESSHIFFDFMERSQALPEYKNTDLAKDWQALVDFVGSDGKSKLSYDQHEKLSEALEQYFYDGKAPTPKLKGVFEAFAEWLKEVYKGLRRHKVLSQETQQAFNKLFATDEEISGRKPTLPPPRPIPSIPALTPIKSKAAAKTGAIEHHIVGDPHPIPKTKAPTDNFGGPGKVSQWDNAKAITLSKFDEFMTTFVNKNRPIQQIQDRLKDVREDIDLFLRETQRPKITASEIKTGWEDNVEPLLKKMAEHKVYLPALEEYAHAMHVPEANRELRYRNAKRYIVTVLNALKKDKTIPREDILSFREDLKEDLFPEDYYNRLNDAFSRFGDYESIKPIQEEWETFAEKASGMTDERAKKLQEVYGKLPHMEELRQMLAKINAARLDILYDAGIITETQYDAMRNKYQYYVPLYREGFDDDGLGTGKGLQPAGRPIKTRMGSTRNVVNIVANTVSNFENAIARAEKAKSAKVFLNLVRANPNPNFWNIQKVKKTPRMDSTGNLSLSPDTQSKASNEIRIMENGKQFIVSVNTENTTALAMLKTLKSEDMIDSKFFSAFSKINQWLARVNTSWSLPFVLTNFTRDIQAAGINIRSTGVKPSKMVRGALSSAATIWKAERGKAKDALWERAKAAGAKIDWVDAHGSVENLASKLTKELETLSGKRPTRRVLQAAGKALGDVNTAIENGVRFHVFKLAVEQGMSDIKAANIASDLTVDFTKKGTAGPAINALFLFANANIQGTYRIVRAIKEKPTLFLTRIAPSIIGLGLVNGLYNAMLGGEDDDGEEYWNKMDDFIKERNMIWMIPGTKGKHAKIPLPWGYNFFYGIGTEISRWFTTDEYSPLDGAGRLSLTFFNAFNPVSSGTLAQTITPTVFDPIVMTRENKNWFGGELMPSQNPYSKVPTPDSQRYWKSVRSPSKWVADTLNSMFGGNKIRSGAVDVSPETFDLLIDTAGGATLKLVSDLFAIPKRLITEEEIQMHNVPFLKSFAGEKSGWADSRIYYDNIQQVFLAQEELKAYKGTEYYNILDKKVGTLRRLFFPAKVAGSNLRRLRKLKNTYEARGDRLAVKQIEEKIQAEYVRFNKRFNAVWR